MSKGKLAGIIIGCSIAVILVIVLVTPPLLQTQTPVRWPELTPIFTLSIGASPSGAGSVSPSGGGYVWGVQVTLTASPASGYTFDYWSGSASGTTPTVTITMDSPKSITANFKIAPEPEPPPETQLHTSRTNPAGLHQPIRAEVDTWIDGKVVLEVEMLELVSGHTAWNMVKAWNMFNDQPEAGKEYILARFRIKIVELEEEPWNTNHAQFDVYSATGVMYTDWVSVAGKNPDLSTNLYEGAEHIGYTAFLVNTDDSPVAVYMARWDEDAIWFNLRA